MSSWLSAIDSGTIEPELDQKISRKLTRFLLTGEDDDDGGGDRQVTMTMERGRLEGGGVNEGRGALSKQGQGSHEGVRW